MAKYLIVVDYQNDFVSGKLGSLRARNIFWNILEKIRNRITQGWQVIFTFDTHNENYLNTYEGRNLQVPHCIEGTDGWKIYRALDEETKVLLKEHRKCCSENEDCFECGPILLKKYTFGYDEWKYLIPDAEEIEVIGVCTDICVISNVLILKAQFPEIPISVDANCCASVTLEQHDAALKTMKSCQVHINYGSNNTSSNNHDEFQGMIMT